MINKNTGAVGSDELKCAASVYCLIKVHDRYKVFLYQWTVTVVGTFPCKSTLLVQNCVQSSTFLLVVISTIISYYNMRIEGTPQCDF